MRSSPRLCSSIEGGHSWAPWTATAAAVAGLILFVRRERSARYPLLDLKLVARPLVAGGLAYKSATGLAIAGMGYMVTLQLQLDWGWSPALAAVGMLPQVIVLVAAGPFVNRFVAKVGFDRAAWLSAVAAVAGLAVYAVLGRFGYGWVALALVLVAAGLRVNGVVAGTNVLRGLPQNRTSIGAALVDTASEVSTGVGLAVTGTILAALFTGDIATSAWTRPADRPVPGGDHRRRPHAHRRGGRPRRVGFPAHPERHPRARPDRRPDQRAGVSPATAIAVATVAPLPAA